MAGTVERKIQLRHDTAENWEAVNPVLALGEQGVETGGDVPKVKYGDGATAWNDLPYFGSISEEDLEAINAGIQTAQAAATAVGEALAATNADVEDLQDFRDVEVPDLLEEKIDVAAIANVLTEAAPGKVLDARQGKALKDLIDALTAAVATKATPADVTAAVAAVIDSSPDALNTLNELAAALGDDPNFATTITNLIGNYAASVRTFTNKTIDSPSNDVRANKLRTGAELPATCSVGDKFVLSDGREFTATATNTWSEVASAQTSGSSALQIMRRNVANDGFELVDPTTAMLTESANKNFVTDAEKTAIGTIGGKQAALVSGTNIKTINGQDILGGGNLDIGGGSTLSGSSLTWGLPYGYVSWINTSLQTFVGSANQVRVARIYVPEAVTIASIHLRVQTVSSGGLCAIGIYSADGNTKLIDSGPKSTTAAAALSTTLGAPVTLQKGFYLMAWTADNTTAATPSCVPFGSSNSLHLAGNAAGGTAANNSAAGVLPTTLGSITAATIAIPIAKIDG